MPTQEKPKCFGQSWDGRDVLCSGGLDPTYQNPRATAEIKDRGRTNIPIHRRDRCVWFQQCAHQTNYNKMRGYIPTENLTKKPQPVRSQQVRPPLQGQTVHQRPSWQIPNHHPPQQQPQPIQHPQYYQQNMAPPWMAGAGPQVVPMPYQQPGAQMPGYLTVPEPVDPRVPGWVRFLIELLRGGAKAVFHTAAHHIDHRPFVRYHPPAPPETGTPPSE